MANSVITKVTGTDSSSNRIASTFYGTCSTGASTAAKAVTLADSCVFNDSCLVTGATIHVKFTNSNTHATPTLKVGTATAKQIMSRGSTKAGTTPETSWYAGAVVSFTYDGTYWQMNDHIDAVDEKVKQTPYPTTASVDPQTTYSLTPILLGKPFDSSYAVNTSDAYAAKGLQYRPGSLAVSNQYYDENWDPHVDTNLHSAEIDAYIERDDSAAFTNAAEMEAYSYLDGAEGEAGVHVYSTYEPSEQTPYGKEGHANIISHGGDSSLELSSNYYSQDLNKYAIVDLYAIADASTDELMRLDLNSSYWSMPIISCIYNEDINEIVLSEDCLLSYEIDRGGVQLTQAEYDALVQDGDVDPDTTYFITDRNNAESAYAASVVYDNTTSGLSATNVQNAIDEVSARANYSTTEHVVGTWIDGTPLYERTVVVDVPSTIDYYIYSYSLDDIPISNPNYNIIMLQSYITHVNVPNQYNSVISNSEDITTITGTSTDVPVVNQDVKAMVDLSEGDTSAYINIVMGLNVYYAITYYNATVTSYVTIRYTKNTEPSN